MNVTEINQLLNGKIIVCGKEDIIYTSACGADLMSDVMAFARDNEILLTGLNNPQVVRTAELLDIKAIVFVRGKKPNQFSIDLAIQKDISIITTDYPMFIACGKLYSNGITGGVLK